MFVILSARTEGSRRGEAKNLSEVLAYTSIEERFFASLRMTKSEFKSST